MGEIGSEICPLYAISRLYEYTDRAQHTVPNSTGTVAKTASTKNTEMTTGPLLGSALKMWFISSRCPYLNGFSYFGCAVLGSVLIFKLKTWLLNPCDVPNDARRRVARRGWEEVRSWTGRSF
jgi:hypothetical protein